MADEDDKPFACNVAGCTMKFISEDHLTVHRKKHEMSLSLNTPNILKETYIDQTPTPTKFIKNCLDVGLFQDLGIHTNPFDEQFRKATQSGTSSVVYNSPAFLSSSTASIGLEHQQESLNTPSVPPLTSDVGLSISSTTGAVILETSCNIPRPVTVLPDPEAEPAEETMPFDTSNGSCDPVVVDDYDLADIENQTVPVVVVKSPKEMGSNVRNIASRNVVQMPVITSVAAVRQNQALLKPKGTVGTKQVVLVSKPIQSTTSTQPVITVATPATLPATSTVIQSVPATSSSVVTGSASNAPMIQLILKLDGQSMPINIPLPTLPSAVPATRVVASSNTMAVQPSTVISNSAREVLKGTVEEKMRKGVPLVVSPVSSGGHATQLLGPKHHTTIGSVNPNNPVAAVPPTVRSSVTPGRKRKEYEEDDPQEKRRRFLERNRAAATRCRLKKKKWVDDLETKCKELTAQNQQLQKEVAMLRNEVANLKTLLLAHKDCPVTQQQMRTNGQPQVYSLSALTSVCASSVSSPQSVSSLRTVKGCSSTQLLETVQLDCASDNSNDNSLQDSSEY